MKITTHICKTMDLGVAGNLFGGQLMAWLDEAASVYAIWLTHEPRVVTRRVSEASFEKPIKCGELVEIHCHSPHPGNTSITFDAQALVDGELRFQAQFTFVAVDETGHKKPIDWEHSHINDPAAQ